MGKKRITTITETKEVQAPEVKAPEVPVVEAEAKVVKTKKKTFGAKHPRRLHGRSRLYQSKKTLVENKAYPLPEAIPLLKKLSYSKLPTVELHLNVQTVGLRGEIKLPHSIGKEIKVAIFDPKLAIQIKQGKIDFDILLARPADMPQIAPLAKALGPKGLMPNPKTNTILADPEKRMKELTSGTTLAYRTELKFPIIHLIAGRLDQKDQELVENITAIINGIGPSQIRSAYLKSTMSPSLRLDLDKLSTAA